MDFLGMLALGLFVGTIISLGIYNTKVDAWQKLGTMLSVTLGAAFGGTVFIFLEALGGKTLGAARFMYPVGLILGMMWVYIRWAEEQMESGTPLEKKLGLGHLVLVLFITAVVLVIVVMAFFPGGRVSLEHMGAL